MTYTIEDPILKGGKLLLEVIALSGSEGCMLRIKREDVPKELQLLRSFGGASGKNSIGDEDIVTDIFGQ